MSRYLSQLNIFSWVPESILCPHFGLFSWMAFVTLLLSDWETSLVTWPSHGVFPRFFWFRLSWLAHKESKLLHHSNIQFCGHTHFQLVRSPNFVGFFRVPMVTMGHPFSHTIPQVFALNFHCKYA
jgi:hypothetical protein